MSTTLWPKTYYTRQQAVQGIQWSGQNLKELSDFLGDCLGPIERRMDYKLKVKGKNDERHFWVEMNVGDLIYLDDYGFHVTAEKWFWNKFENPENKPVREFVMEMD